MIWNGKYEEGDAVWLSVIGTVLDVAWQEYGTHTQMCIRKFETDTL